MLLYSYITQTLRYSWDISENLPSLRSPQSQNKIHKGTRFAHIWQWAAIIFSRGIGSTKRFAHTGQWVVIIVPTWLGHMTEWLIMLTNINITGDVLERYQVLHFFTWYDVRLGFLQLRNPSRSFLPKFAEHPGMNVLYFPLCPVSQLRYYGW